MISVPRKARRWCWTRRGDEFRPPEKYLGSEFLPRPGPICQSQFGKNRVSMTLQRDGADLNVGATFGDKLAIARKRGQPQIDIGGYAEIVLAQYIEIAHLEH